MNLAIEFNTVNLSLGYIMSGPAYNEHSLLSLRNLVNYKMFEQLEI
jgi:hypothetical protein